MKIALLLTGNELMSGDTVDSNSSMIAKAIAPYGFSIDKKLTVGDDPGLLRASLESLVKHYSVVIVNGGLGPTSDDLTAEIVADVAGLDITEHQQARAHVESWCGKRGIAINQANLKQALLPAGCQILANPAGSAVGIIQRIDETVVYSTPGVPSELKAMLAGDLLADLQTNFPNEATKRITRMRLFGIGESRLQQKIIDSGIRVPEGCEIGFRAGLPILELKVEVDSSVGESQEQQFVSEIEALVSDYLIGWGDDTLPDALLRCLKESNSTVAFAESCTGGLMASWLTALPGSSQVFETGAVTYSNTSKSKLLGVRESTLETHGAVSEQVVAEMLDGVLKLSNADYAAVTSGIAGPDGGTQEKPVGTVWIAWGNNNERFTEKFYFPTSRKNSQTIAAAKCFDHIRRMVLKLEEPELLY